MTFGVFKGLTIYAFFVGYRQTKTDFTMKFGLINVLCWSLLWFALSISFMHSRVLDGVFCWIAVACYGTFIVYDTQCVFGNKAGKLTYDDYVLGALMLYIVTHRQDLIGLFVNVLGCFFGKK